MRKRSRHELGVNPRSIIHLPAETVTVWAGPSAFDWRHIVFEPQLDEPEVRAIRTVEQETWLEYWDPNALRGRVWMADPSRGLTRRDQQLLDHVRGLPDAYVLDLARALAREKTAEAERQAAAATELLECHQEHLRALRLREAALGMTSSQELAVAVRIADSFPSASAVLLQTVAGIIDPVVLPPETPPTH